MPVRKIEKKEEKNMRKLLAVVLALTMALTLAMPLLAHADDLEEITILYPGEETDEMAAFLNGAFADRVKEELHVSD